MPLKWKHDSKRRIYQNDKFIITHSNTKKFYGYIVRLKTTRKNFKFMDVIGKVVNLNAAKKIASNYLLNNFANSQPHQLTN